MLNLTDIEYYINLISTGLKVVEVEGSLKKETVIFRQPSAQDKIFANFVYDKTYNEAISDGLLTVEQMETVLREKGLINDDLDRQIELLRGKIDAQKKVLEKTLHVKVNRTRIENIIKSLENELVELLNKRNMNFGITAEAKATEARLLFLCKNNVFKDVSRLLWKSDGDFNNEKDFVFRSNVLTLYSEFVSGLPIKIIRYIARHSLWRVKYISSLKCGVQLFNVPAVDFSVDQINLLYWSHFYQSIYEMLPEDQPSDEIIEDDDALDSYMDSYYKELKQEALARKSGKRQGTLNAFDKEEVIVTASHEMFEDFEFDKPREAALIKDRVDVRKRGKKRTRK